MGQAASTCRVALLLCGAVLVAGCFRARRLSPHSAAEPGTVAGVPAGEPSPLETALAEHFVVQRGSYETVNGPECCDQLTGCAGNNPSTPYLGFWAPPAPGQVAPTLFQREDGMSWHLRLRADEALLYVGLTPPETRYFGFTPYLWQRGPVGFPVLVSLSETLNHEVIATDAPAGEPPFERQIAVVATSDAGTLQAVTRALVASGFPAKAINPLVFDAAVSRFGLRAIDDTFGVMFRAAQFADPAQKEAFFAAPPGQVYRLTPRVEAPPNPLPVETRPKGTASEAAYAGAVDQLQAALLARYPEYQAELLTVEPHPLDPPDCLALPMSCLADNRDTIYPQVVRLRVFTGGDEFYVAFGVNHDRSGKTTYSNVSVYAVDHMYGVVAATSDQYDRSAVELLPEHPDAEMLYALRITRRCNGEPFCLEVPYGSCPNGIEDDRPGSITFRTYLEPGTGTGPDRDTLVAERVLHFHR